MNRRDEDIERIAGTILGKYGKQKKLSLNSDEVTNVLKDAYEKSGFQRPTPAHVSQMISKYDRNRDRTIDKAELKLFLSDLFELSQ